MLSLLKYDSGKRQSKENVIMLAPYAMGAGAGSRSTMRIML